MGRPLLYDEVPVGQCKVRAIFSWSGETSEDLGFVEGDIIEVLNTGDGDWWTGKLKRNRVVGHFPRNFVEYVDENQETMSAAAYSKANRGGGKPEMVSLESTFAGLNKLSLADLQINEPLESTALKSSTGSAGLGASANSQRSTKSAQEILKDIGDELNREYLNDIAIKSQPEELMSPELGYDVGDDWAKLDAPAPPAAAAPLPSEDSSNSLADAAPVPPPHKVSPAASLSRRSHQQSLTSAPSPLEDLLAAPSSSAPRLEEPAFAELSGPGSRAPPHGASERVKPAPSNLSDPQSLDPRALESHDVPSRAASPILQEEVPFDPRAFQPEMPIGNHIGSHLDIDTSTYSAGQTNSEEKPMTVSRTRPSKAAMESSGADHSTPTTVVMFPSGDDEDSGKNRFFEKLFPKNSQIRLRRSTSRASQKSSRSVRSYQSVKAKLRGIKSIFSFAPLFKPDDDIYPANTFTHSDPSPGTMPHSDFKSSHYNASSGPTAPSSTVAGGGGISSAHLDNKDKNLGGKWIRSRRDLYRAKTLTDRDVLKRRRAMELQGINCDDLIEPLKVQSENDFHDYRLEKFADVDGAVLTMSTWPQLMTPAVFASSRIGRHFSDPVERVRAVFLVCATHISHVAQTPAGNNVMQSRKATPLELAQTVAAMLTALDVECLVVEGHIRIAGRNTLGVESAEHAWNAVKLEGEWRFLDCFSAAAGSSMLSKGISQDADATADAAFEGDESINLFYFLTPPTQLIFTHVPTDQKYQFLKPSLPTATAALLPIASPAAFAHGIVFDNFWLGVTRLSDLEMSELILDVPNGATDLVALVNNEPALAQAYRSADGRKVRVKAFVPHGRKQAVLQIYALNKQQPAVEMADLELLWTVELRHVSGESNNAPYEFVRRFASPQAVHSDLYVVEPQCRVLGGGDLYTFQVQHSPASTELVRQPQLAIQSPSGRITRLVPFGTDLTDTFKASVKTLEVGTWRAVVRPEASEPWVPFAEWFCE